MLHVGNIKYEYVIGKCLLDKNVTSEMPWFSFTLHLNYLKVRMFGWCLIAEKQTLAPPLTHVVCDDGERPQVGLPDVLGQSVGVVLKVAEKMGCAALRFLDLLPVLLVAGIQYWAAGLHQVLREEIYTTSVTELVGVCASQLAGNNCRAAKVAQIPLMQ